MNCFENLIKYIMFLVNALFVLAGVVLIGFGAYAQIKSKNVLNFVGDNYTNTPIAIVVLGMYLVRVRGKYNRAWSISERINLQV